MAVLDQPSSGSGLGLFARCPTSKTAAFWVRQTREGLHITVYETVRAIRLTLDKPGEEIMDGDPHWYADGALRAAKNDKFGSIERQRELEPFLQPSDESPRSGSKSSSGSWSGTLSRAFT